MNVFRNYLPNKYIVIDDKDSVWMSKIIKSKLETKNKLYQQYIQIGRFESDLVFTESLIAELNDLISYTKDLYYENLAKKLNKPLLQAKTYWSIFKSFYNDGKVPLIPPFLIDYKFATDIQTKAKTFNNFFADQCQPLNNAGDLPTNQIFLTQSRVASLDFNEGELLQIIRALKIYKAHGHDDISIRMIKICDKSLSKPLIVLFRKSIKSSCYPDIWEKVNIIPAHKKMTNNWLKTTDQFFFYPSWVKYSKILFSVEFITFCWKKIS